MAVQLFFFSKNTFGIPLAADVIVKVVVAAAPRQFNSSLCSIAHARAGPEKFILKKLVKLNAFL